MRRLAPLAMSLLFLGCGRAPRSEPAAAESPASQAPDSQGPAEHPDDAEATTGESRAPAAPAEETAPAGTKKAKSDGAEAERMPSEGAAADDATTLAEHERMLGSALAPSTLSCAGAEPHVAAICRIAERICQSARSHPGTMAARDCQNAESSCEKAKRDFSERCH